MLVDTTLDKIAKTHKFPSQVVAGGGVGLSVWQVAEHGYAGEVGNRERVGLVGLAGQSDVGSRRFGRVGVVCGVVDVSSLDVEPPVGAVEPKGRKNLV